MRFAKFAIEVGLMATKVVYFTVGDRDEQAEFKSSDSPTEIRGLFLVKSSITSTSLIKSHFRIALSI